MKHLITKKPFAFIIALMMFSLLPEFLAAQSNNKRCPKEPCPFGYICIKGDCKRYFPFLTDGSPANEAVSISSANSNAISFQLTQAQNVSAKIYDATGRLVKTLADKAFELGDHKLQWDAAGVNAGIYIVQLNTGTYSETKKISVIK